MEIEKPIILIGTGRCGSTFLHYILAKHPNVAFLNTFSLYFPHKIWLTKLGMTLYSISDKTKIKPREAYRFFEKYSPEFIMPFRDLTEKDVTYYSKFNLNKLFKKILSSKRNRLLLKITGWPRVSYLNAIFPNALFLHILRDGRAFVNSIIKQRWWYGFRGPENWRFGKLSEKFYKLWEKYDFSFIALAAIQWLILIRRIEESARNINKERFMELKYEELTQDLEFNIRRIIEFIGLEWNKKFEREISKIRVKNMNFKYKQDLTQGQIEIINEILGNELKRKGYKLD